jgi:hypothetical protein
MVRTVSTPFEKASLAPVTCARAAPLREMEPCALLKAVLAAVVGVPPLDVVPRTEPWPTRLMDAVAAPEGEKSISRVSARTPVQRS